MHFLIIVFLFNITTKQFLKQFFDEMKYKRELVMTLNSLNAILQYCVVTICRTYFSLVLLLNRTEYEYLYV